MRAIKMTILDGKADIIGLEDFTHSEICYLSKMLESVIVDGIIKTLEFNKNEAQDEATEREGE